MFGRTSCDAPLLIVSDEAIAPCTFVSVFKTIAIWRYVTLSRLTLTR